MKFVLHQGIKRAVKSAATTAAAKKNKLVEGQLKEG